MSDYQLEDEEQQGNIDPYALFVYGIRSPYTKESYFRRLRSFFDAINLGGGTSFQQRLTRSFAREEPIQTGHLIIFLDSCIIKKKPGKINKEWRNTSNTYMQSGADIKGRRRKGSTTPH